MADHKQDESTFRVIDRRPFTSEGELRKEAVEEQEREAKREEKAQQAAKAAEAQKPAKGNLAPEEDNLLLDLLGKLKMTYLEINQAMTAQAAGTQTKAKGRP